MICEGRLNKEIADALGISQDAVKQHVAAIKRKLRVQTRAQIGFHRRVP
jgi:DNA-binding CsgD family transcriptional regulator